MLIITAETVKLLRNKTGISVMECKKALEEGGGDIDKALLVLSRRSADIAKKKSDRVLAAGVVATYIHNNGQIGAMVLLSCETDFVSKNEEFMALARNIAMHITATRPLFLRREQVGEAELVAMRNLFMPDVIGKPENLKEQILTGKVNSRLKELVLLEQSYIKDDSKTIADLLSTAGQKFGERIEISKYSCFSAR